MPQLHASFISNFKQPIESYLDSSIIARARRANILSTEIISILESQDGNHHKIDDTPYGGGPGELMRIDIIAPLIEQALALRPELGREKKRVILLDPAGAKFKQAHAKRLSQYQELIFVCGRYEGIDARVHYFIDEALSLGDFVLSNGDIAATAIFDATARLIRGVLGNHDSLETESHAHKRLEASQYTRPLDFRGFKVPEVFTQGHHQLIFQERQREAIIKTSRLRPDLIQEEPLSQSELALLMAVDDDSDLNYPWTSHELPKADPITKLAGTNDRVGHE